MAVHHTSGINPHVLLVPEALLSLGDKRKKVGKSRCGYVMSEENNICRNRARVEDFDFSRRVDKCSDSGLCYA